MSTKLSFFRLYFSKNIDWNEKPIETTNILTYKKDKVDINLVFFVALSLIHLQYMHRS